MTGEGEDSAKRSFCVGSYILLSLLLRFSLYFIDRGSIVYYLYLRYTVQLTFVLCYPNAALFSK